MEKDCLLPKPQDGRSKWLSERLSLRKTSGGTCLRGAEEKTEEQRCSNVPLPVQMV